MERKTRQCAFCHEHFDADHIMDLNGKPICFPCAVTSSWFDQKRRQRKMVNKYDEALAEQRNAKKANNLIQESGICETKRGTLYYPDDDYSNVYHIVGNTDWEF
jgi:hypothetical protein